MLVKKVKIYEVPIYPKGAFVSPRRSRLADAAGVGALATAAILSIETIGCGDTTDGIIAPPLISENEARTVIRQVFTDNGITLTEDVDLAIPSSGQSTKTVSIDGYNDSLQVGYDYYTPGPEDLTGEEVATLDSLVNEDGPYLKTISYWDDGESVANLQAIVQQFIDSLQSRGVL